VNIFKELYRHGKLAEKRSPFYEKSKYAKLFAYIMAAFWLGYLIFFGILFAFAFQGEAVEPYHIINQGLLFVLFLDYVMRFAFQKLPTQEMQPYLLLPVKRSRLLDALLIRSGLSGYNFLWFFMFVPFALLTVFHYYGLWGVIAYNIGIWLLVLINNYWYLLTRTLIGESPWWIILPVAVYGGLAAWMFIPDECPVFDFSMNVGEGFITSNVLTFLGALAGVALMWLICKAVMSRLTYNELTNVEDTKVKHVSEYKFLNRFGEVGEFMRLELKMLARNKVPKQQSYSVFTVVIMFVLLMSFTDVYDGAMSSFLLFYNFVIFGIMFLSQVMSYEGNYIDGLITRKESIYNLLSAKYYLYSVMMIIPLILMIPAMVTGKSDFLTCVAWMIFIAGPVFCLFFQLAVYNKQTVPLNKKIAMRMNGTSIQFIITAVVFGVPLILRFALDAIVGTTATNWIFIALGIAFIATHRWWLMNVYKRFMVRKYVNMEGFRNTRE